MTNRIGGYLVPARDANAVAGIIREALNDPMAAAIVGVAGKQAVLPLSWGRNARRTYGACRRVVRDAQ